MNEGAKSRGRRKRGILLHIAVCSLLLGCSNPLMEEILAPLFYELGGPGPGGGVIFYDKGNFSGGWRWLEAAPTDAIYNNPDTHTATDSSMLYWAYQSYDGYISTETGIGTGRANTIRIIRDLGANAPAAYACTNYRNGGFSDWFLPSKDELNELYKMRSYFNFPDTDDNWYWSSSQSDSDEYAAWAQNLLDGDGEQSYHTKNTSLYRVRPIRAF